MEEAGLVERNRRGGVLPARAPAELTLADLTLAVHGVYNPVEPGTHTTPRAAGFEVLDAFFRESDRAGLDVLRRTRWVDLAILVRPGLAEAQAATAAATAPAPSPPETVAGSGNP
jgi:membrane protein